MSIVISNGLPTGAAPPAAVSPNAGGQHRAWQNAMEQALMEGWFQQPSDARESFDAQRGAQAASPVPGMAPPAKYLPRFGVNEACIGRLERPGVTSPIDGLQPDAPDVAASGPGVAAAVPAGMQPSLGPASATEPAPGSAAVPGNGPGAAPSGALTPARATRSAVAVQEPAPALRAVVVAPPLPQPQTAIAPIPLHLIARHVASELATHGIESSESAFAPAWRTARTAVQEAPDAPTRLHVEWTADGARLWLGVDHSQLHAVPALAGQLQQWLAASGVKLVALVCNGRTLHDAQGETPPFASSARRPRALLPTYFLPIESPGDRE